MVDAALDGVVVTVRRGGEAVLAVETGRWAGTLRMLDRRRRGLSEGRMQVRVVPRPLRFIVNVGVVDQRDVVDEVVDEKLGVRHEIVDRIPGCGFLGSVIKGATERFHHPHLHGSRGDEAQRENRVGEVRTWRGLKQRRVGAKKSFSTCVIEKT